MFLIDRHYSTRADVAALQINRNRIVQRAFKTAHHDDGNIVRREEDAFEFDDVRVAQLAVVQGFALHVPARVGVEELELK